MRLSIIIINFNTKSVISDCLDSLQQNYEKEIKQGSFEVIVVDNASVDGSVSYLKKKYAWVKYIVNKENVGFSKANNAAITQSKGELILLLNPDTCVPNGVFNEMISYMEKNQSVGVSTCKVILKNGKLDDASHRGFPTPLRALFHFIGLAQLFSHSTFFNGYHLGYQNMDKIHEIDACAGAFLLIRRIVGDRVGWLDEDYFWYGEDLDLCFKVKELGYKVMYVPTVSIIHVKGAASGIKKHSKNLTTIDAITKQKIVKARFDVMRIFYKKHYAHLYPGWMTNLVLLGIGIKQKLTEFNL